MTLKLEIPHVQQPVINWLDKRNIEYLRLNGRGRRAFPDIEIFLKGGRPFLIEFKRPGEDPEPLQQEKIDALLLLGYDVEVHDDPKEAIAAIRLRLKKCL